MKKQPPAFDLEAFLVTENGGRNLQTYKKNEVIFSQGDRCDGVFYIHSGTCKVTVISEQGKEAIVAVHEKGISLAKVV
jgi:CRP-like cAMP-binding protein